MNESPASRRWLPLRIWITEGLRASLLRNPRTAGAAPTPLQAVSVFALNVLLLVVAGRLEVAGPAVFDLHGLLAPWWVTLASLWLAWLFLPRNAPGAAVAWFTLWSLATVPATALSIGLAALQAHGLLPEQLLGGGWMPWTLFALIWAWILGTARHLARLQAPSRGKLAGFMLGLAAVLGLMLWQFQDRPWQVDYNQAETEQKPRLHLTQEAFEAQQALMRGAADALLPQRPGLPEVYGIVFAPYASQDVFLRESTMVAGVLATRFDAAGRTLQLVNHASTTATLPWATPLNLTRAIDAVAAKMDREQDVLVLYMTSHGASDFKLAASHWPLEVGELTPTELRRALDASGIRNRVIIISACYSGGWVEPLASDTTLVMTAADATHTSYGCGSRSELTFFGRAMFDEQLRKTHSFEEAFAAAVPVIRQREIEGKKPDGFSNPQFSMGARIAPVLDALAQRLEAPTKP